MAAFGVLAVVSAGEARQHNPPQSHAGDFDFYLLSMSIAPSFCALSPANRSKPDCRDLTAETFRETPLTIHGLWPNRAHVSVNQQPSHCTHVPLQMSDAVKADLARYMPGGPGLQQHEWSKHGTCSGLSPDDYFAAAVSLARQMNDVVGGVMQSSGMLGGDVDVRRVIDGVAAKDPALAAAIIVDCRQPSGGGAPRRPRWSTRSASPCRRSSSPYRPARSAWVRTRDAGAGWGAFRLCSDRHRLRPGAAERRAASECWISDSRSRSDVAGPVVTAAPVTVRLAVPLAAIAVRPLATQLVLAATLVGITITVIAAAVVQESLRLFRKSLSARAGTVATKGSASRASEAVAVMVRMAWSFPVSCQFNAIGVDWFAQ